MQKPFHKKTKWALKTGGASLLILLAVLTGVVYMLKQKEDSIQKKMQEIRVQEMRNTQMQEARHILAQTTEDQKEIDRYLITEDEVVSFIEEIEGLARQAGVNLSLNNIREAEISGYKALTLTYEAQGTWDETIAFLSISELLPASVIIDRAWLRKEEVEEIEEGEGRWFLDMTVSLLGFNRKLNL